MLKKSLSDQSVAQNKAKSLNHQTQTLRNRGFRFLNRGQKRARRSFSTSWFILGNLPPYAPNLQ
jgi:hypothetical protein